MATKKGKKSKGVTISFQEFTARVEGEGAPAAGQNVVYAPKKPVLSSWADEVEEDELITEKERIVLPSAPRASRGPAYDDSEIPRSPPFQINLGNLNYDIDEEDIYKFFRDLEIQELKLPRDRETNRIKGFGFVTFETRKDLIEALIRNEQMVRGRPIRIQLGQDRGQAGFGGGQDRRPMRGDRPPAEDEGVDNWRTVMGSEQGAGGAVMERGRDGDRGNYERRDRGDRDRSGGGGGMMMDRSEMRPLDRGRDYNQPRRNYEEGPQRRYNEDRRNSPSGSNEDVSTWRGQGGPPPRGHSPSNNEEEEEFVRPAVVAREEFVRRPVERDDERRPERGGEEQREERSERPGRREPEEPKQRKKLVLQPRSTGIVEEVKNYASIFGEAKPVDTTKRELEIEEKLKVDEEIKVDNSEKDGEEHKKYRLLSRDGSRTEKLVDISLGIGKKPDAKRVEKYSWRNSHYRDEDSRGPPREQQRDTRGPNRGERGRRTSQEYEEGYGRDRNTEKDRDSHSEPEDDRDFKQQQQYYNRESQDRNTQRYGPQSQQRRPQQQQNAPERRDYPQRGRGQYESRGQYNRGERDVRGDSRGDTRGDSRDSRSMESQRRYGNQGNRRYDQQRDGQGQQQRRIVDKDGFESAAPGPRRDNSDRFQQQPPPVQQQTESDFIYEKSAPLAPNKFAFLSNSSGDED